MSEKEIQKEVENETMEEIQEIENETVSEKEDEIDINQILELAKKSEEYLNHLQRLQAEFENYRKRVTREKTELAKYCTQELILQFIEVFNNFNRAIEAGKENENSDSLKEGVEMIAKQFWGILEKNQVSKIESLGEKFDPTFHEALMMDQDSEVEDGIITAEIQPGYKLADRVIAASKVKVNRVDKT